jgi:hypothetical protein
MYTAGTVAALAGLAHASGNKAPPAIAMATSLFARMEIASFRPYWSLSVRSLTPSVMAGFGITRTAHTR